MKKNKYYAENLSCLTEIQKKFFYFLTQFRRLWDSPNLIALNVLDSLFHMPKKEGICTGEIIFLLHRTMWKKLCD